MEGTCILCGEELDDDINREHYICQTILRSLGELGIPSNFDWIVRTNEYKQASSNERISVSIKAHKTWAVVWCHRSCNLDASKVCRSFRYIIDHLDKEFPKDMIQDIIDYYSHIWSVAPKFVEVGFISKEAAANEFRNQKSFTLYEPGMVNLGRIKIMCHTIKNNDQQRHTIYCGERKELDK